MNAIETKATKTDVYLQIKAEHPWRVRAYGKPLWLALVLHPFHVRYRRGIIYIKEVLT